MTFYAVRSGLEVSPHGFTCTSSSEFSSRETCKEIYAAGSKQDPNAGNGWVTKGKGVGSWVKILFHSEILISKIVYRHNNKITYPYRCCNQNFKDISIEFSDGTHVNVSLDDVFSKDFQYKIMPPKLSSSLKLSVYSVYNHSTADENGNYGMIYFNDRYGLRKLRLFGDVKQGNPCFL